MTEVHKTMSPSNTISWIIASVDVSSYGLIVYSCKNDGLGSQTADARVDLAVDNLVAGCKPHWILYKGKIVANNCTKKAIEALVGPKFHEVKTETDTKTSENTMSAEKCGITPSGNRR